MRKLIVSEFVSLDGVIQAPGSKDEDTDGGFSHGGWTWPYWDDKVDALSAQAMSESDALLLGRKTWQIIGSFFEPMAAGDPSGDVMNAMPKYVISTTLADASAWRNSTLISGDVVEAVRGLKAQPGKNIVVNGSSVLVHTLAQNDLIDEYYLLIFPITLGIGARLFADDSFQTLRLVETQSSPSGVVLTRYQPVKSEKSEAQ